MSTETNHPNKKAAVDFACTASLFAVAGPPLGAASIFLVILLFKIPTGSFDISSILGLAIIVISYVIGLVPAVIVGILVASRGVWSAVSLAFTMTATSAAILILFLGHAFVTMLFGSTFNMPLYLLLLKAVAIGAYPAAIMCWLIAGNAGWLRQLRWSFVPSMPPRPGAM